MQDDFERFIIYKENLASRIYMHIFSRPSEVIAGSGDFSLIKIKLFLNNRGAQDFDQDFSQLGRSITTLKNLSFLSLNFRYFISKKNSKEMQFFFFAYNKDFFVLFGFL